MAGLTSEQFQRKYKYQVSGEYPRLEYCWVCKHEVEKNCIHPELDEPMETFRATGMCSAFEDEEEMDDAEEK